MKRVISHPLFQLSFMIASILVFYLTRKSWLTSAWQTFGPINIPGNFGILLLPTSIIYIPFMSRLDFVGGICLFFYLYNRHLKQTKLLCFLYGPEIPFDRFEYSFGGYKSYFTELTYVDFIHSNFYYPIGAAISACIILIFYLRQAHARKF